jgi:multidrug efflux system outer membrane protein
LRAVDANRSVVARALEIRRKALELMGKRQKVGEISGLDLARAQTEVATAEADRLQLEQERSRLTGALAVLTGRPATGMVVTDRPELPVPPRMPVGIPSEVLRNRPDIRAAERRVAAANAEIGVATAAFYPSFSLNAAGGFNAERLADLFDASSLVWSVGAGMLAPVTEQKKMTAERQAAVEAHAAASADYRQAVLEALREVEDAVQGAVILERRQQAQDQAVVAAGRTLDLSAKRFRAGMESFLDVVDAERTRLDAERLANLIRGERLAVAVSLARALGGEW